MNGFVPVLDSGYIIDGVKMELTPRQMLDDAAGICGTVETASGDSAAETVVDESIDQSPSGEAFDGSRIYGYLELVEGASGKPRNIPAYCPEEITRAETSRALIDAIWKTGHFRLDDLMAEITWEWETSAVGNLASFYRSVSAACSFLDALGIKLGGYTFTESARGCRVRIRTEVEKGCIEDKADDTDEPVDIAESIDREIVDTPDMTPSMPKYELPFRTMNPKLGKKRKCSSTVSGDCSNWLIYIPFDTCKFRLGGSLLSEKAGITGGKAPEADDSDYFIDCFEVMREFVEDGIIVSGATVAAGGVMSTLKKMIPAGRGIDADISCIMKSYGEDDVTKILFGEIPGAVVEIRDEDFDYVDAELLLQDVAYYPVGHPGGSGLRLIRNGSASLSEIMQAIIGQVGTAPEGED